ncbi:hypothetical protein [Sphingobacterium hotanense]|uniref:hypothetical protein n=1 Tax=Sphingobacterium hotanense TaxID=649196 RepID=UPI0016598D88|nr:hypothetical protein [Sphingobacterium hotanense]
MRWILIFLLFISLNILNAQESKICVSKEAVKMDYDGYLLKITVEKDGRRYETRPGDYQQWVDFMWQFEFKERVEILKQLSHYFDDYSLCSKAVEALLPAIGMPRTIGHDSKETRYTIAVEAMFLINWMAFGDMAAFLSTKPILFDVEKKTAVAYDDYKSIKKLAKLYRRWVKKKQKDEDISMFEMFELDSGQVIWEGSDLMQTVERKQYFLKTFRNPYGYFLKNNKLVRAPK